ncbi:nuclear transport factor 2 family protein [Pseudoxanthomonas sp.]|uniref:nuclear transport factor 2 family protein n=1 Tax=Pseudoxanthomonas sp. TaxID=1871049 RepID=UPI0026304BD5|nr:nuclear transport factor 2 family protein [Pseudoxanthomonas sp.]WDS34818.1 MAG: nuclear transport factor 2 family protein [Pseudoxanthomonas sp.]
MLLAVFVVGVANARAAPPATAPDELAAVRQADAAFWEAYNRCDLAAMGALLTPDVEFWHDKTGLTSTRAAVVQSLAAGPCGTPGMHLRREAVAGSVQVYPLADAGALITGQHRFLVTRLPQPERLDGSARFSSVWTRGPDMQWRMHRIMSFDHQAAPYRATDPVLSLDAGQLQRLVGRYDTRAAGLARITVEGTHLLLTAGDFHLPLYAASPRRFFARERDLQVVFDGVGDAPPTHLEIVEAGVVSERAPRVP